MFGGLLLAVLRADETGIDEETSWQGRDARPSDTRRRACRLGASSVRVPIQASPGKLNV